MFKLDDTIVWSATDLTLAAKCEFALLRKLDVELGRIEKPEAEEDKLLERIARLGDQHEARALDGLLAQYGPYTSSTGAGVYLVERPDRFNRPGLVARQQETLDVLKAGADVVFQATFFDGRFQGFADFLVREPDTQRYVVCDTKLARHAKTEALLQLAAYADQLTGCGIEVGDDAELWLGDGTRAAFSLADIGPVFRERRERLLSLIDEHVHSEGPILWGDERITACGRCDICTQEVEASRDLLLVAGMRMTQRKVLRQASLRTIEDLAARAEPVAGMARRTFESLHAQAALQVRQDQAPEPLQVLYDIHAPEVLAQLPAPSPGDIFFDFEGDPMWVEGTSHDWGLEYLFGLVEAPVAPDATPVFRSFWAHDRAAEKAALQEFMDYVAQRRAKYPDMHIYHYAAYEKTALLRLSLRHGACEGAVDDLLRNGVLIDLYSTVRAAVRVSQPSYSIKKLEPLYMGGELRKGDVQDAAASIVEYHAYCEARQRGDQIEADRLLADIGDYNNYDCLSTLRLRGWLLARAYEMGAAVTELEPAETTPPEEPDPLELELLEFADAGERTPDQQAVAMLAAALGYNRRERKPYWWAHFDRLSQPSDEWVDTKDVLVAERVEVLSGWAKPTPRKNPRRRVRLVGRFGIGSTAADGDDKVKLLYDVPVPDCIDVPVNSSRGCTRSSVTVVSRDLDDDGRDVVVVDEALPKAAAEYDHLPVALVPGDPVYTQRIDAAIREVAVLVATGLPTLPEQPAIDMLRATPPRLRGDRSLYRAGVDADDNGDAIYRSLLALDRSYIAVQGPPGTGKTYVGAQVIARLVREKGWRVGVVAQGHAVVENMLDAVVEAGVPAARVGKRPRDNGTSPSWTALADKGHAAFLEDHETTGCVVGGTAWDFTHDERVARECLDLLVIDEAGQFSLASTVAVSVCADRLLLLGDPQQLPQVSQGIHPEPVDGSALGWLIDGQRTLPPERGYFLETTWRMHPDLCVADSRLSYDGRLHSNEAVTATRLLVGVDPGVEVIELDHVGNSVESAEEAEEVARQVRSLIGRMWTERPEAEPRGLEQQDVRVVAPYNAQVAMIRKALASGGFPDVPVGTVDKFQGQQAPVVIVSMTASAVDDIPRGMDFLLNRNRVNVAISRGKWKAVIIRSGALTRYMPTSPQGLLELGAFIGLCERRDSLTGTLGA